MPYQYQVGSTRELTAEEARQFLVRNDLKGAVAVGDDAKCYVSLLHKRFKVEVDPPYPSILGLLTYPETLLGEAFRNITSGVLRSQALFGGPREIEVLYVINDGYLSQTSSLRDRHATPTSWKLAEISFISVNEAESHGTACLRVSFDCVGKHYWFLLAKGEMSDRLISALKIAVELATRKPGEQ